MSGKQNGLAYTDRFDGQHFVFSNINGELLQYYFFKRYHHPNIKLSTKEKSGFEVKQLVADMKFTPDIMEFNNLDVTTGKSRLGDYYAMRYKDFNADMSDFLHRIKLEGQFKKSNIHSDDIAFFAPEVKFWNRLFILTVMQKGASIILLQPILN